MAEMVAGPAETAALSAASSSDTVIVTETVSPGSSADASIVLDESPTTEPFTLHW